MDKALKEQLHRGLVIPALPLALTAGRKLDERGQRALVRYYAAAGAGGLAVAVHTTQFAIRNPQVGLFRPILALAAEELDRADRHRAHQHRADQHQADPLIRIAGVLGKTGQAVEEAAVARDLGYHAGLLSLSAMRGVGEDELMDHCRAVSEVLPVVGFYLQPAAGGRPLPYSFWRRFAELPNVVAIKMAPFNRYQTIDVVRAVAEAGRDDIALYTGNDDNIVMDLLTPYRFKVGDRMVERRIVGGLLGHWACWTQKAVSLLSECKSAVANGGVPSEELLRRNIEVTDCNAAFFDVANNFAGCIAGIHEVLRRQGLLEGIWCLDENEGLSPGQAAEITRVYAAYPHLNDDAFVDTRRAEWLNG